MWTDDLHTSALRAELRRGIGMLAVLLAGVMASATVVPPPAAPRCADCRAWFEPNVELKAP